MSTKQLIWQKALFLLIGEEKKQHLVADEIVSQSPAQRECHRHLPVPLPALQPAASSASPATQASSRSLCTVYSFPSQNNTEKKKENLTQNHTDQNPFILLGIPGVKEVGFDTSERSHHCHSTPPPRLHKA